MNEFDDFIQQSHDDSMDLIGDVFTFRGREIRGVFSETEYGNEIKIAGYSEEAEATLTVTRHDMFADPGRVPTTGRRITRKKTNQEYRITRWVDNDGGLIDLELQAVAQGGGE